MLTWGQHILDSQVSRVYTRRADGRVEIITVEFSNGALMDILLGQDGTVAPYFWTKTDLIPPDPGPQPPPLDYRPEALLGASAHPAVVEEELVQPVEPPPPDPAMARIMAAGSIEEMMQLLQGEETSGA